MKIWYRCHFITHLDFWVWDFLRYIICTPKTEIQSLHTRKLALKSDFLPSLTNHSFPKRKRQCPHRLTYCENIISSELLDPTTTSPHTLYFFFFFALSLYILILTAVWITDLIICGQSNRIGFIFRKEYKMGQTELLWSLGLGAIWGLMTSISWDTLFKVIMEEPQTDKKKATICYTVKRSQA